MHFRVKWRFDDTSSVMAKDTLLKPISAVGGIAAVVFFFMPLRTFTQVLLCSGSLAIAFICAAMSASLNDENTGYWPDKPKQ